MTAASFCVMIGMNKICAGNPFTSDHFEHLQLMKRQVQSLHKNQARSFLLRPGTKNAILWRRLSLACATLELLQNALHTTFRFILGYGFLIRRTIVRNQ